MKIHPDIEQGSPAWLALRSQYFTASTLGDWLIEEPKMDLTVKEMTDFLNDIGTPIPKGAKWADLAALLPEDVREKHMSYTARRDDAWNNAIYARLGSISLDEEPQWDTWATKRGKALESSARLAYAVHQGLEIVETEEDGPTVPALIQVGFCAHDSDDFGNSPDGLVLREWGKAIPAHRLLAEDFQNGGELKCHIARTHARFLLEGGFREEHAMQVHASMAATGIREWHLFGYHPELPPLFEVFKWDETTDKVLAGLLRLSECYWKAYADLKGMYRTTAEQPEPAGA